MSLPVIAIFDAGKTNKKVFLFDEQYHLVEEHSSRFDEIADEDGYPCEDVHALRSWITGMLPQLISSREFDVKAINFTSYGASFVHLDTNGKPILPLYNYLKPFPPDVLSAFFDAYGEEDKISRETASPVLGHLNSGLLLYRLKQQKSLLETAGYSLHLPQYLSYVITRQPYSDLTSIGCHTMLWNFETQTYHRWVEQEAISKRLAPLVPGDHVNEWQMNGKTLRVGTGLHDSSSALIPYLAAFEEPFVLLSTGTWSITLNPFNEVPLTPDELKQDCLCYLTYRGKPVKASRLFAGHMHEEGVKQLNAHFNKNGEFYRTVKFDHERVQAGGVFNESRFEPELLNEAPDYETAYHMFISHIIAQQIKSTNLVLDGRTRKIFVDGGFSKNEVYMKLLAAAYPDMEVYAASVAQATAMGAAVAIHSHWSSAEMPPDLVQLTRY